MRDLTAGIVSLVTAIVIYSRGQCFALFSLTVNLYVDSLTVGVIRVGWLGLRVVGQQCYSAIQCAFSR